MTNCSIHWCDWSIIFCDLAKNCCILAHVGLRHIGQRWSRRRLHATFPSRCVLTTSAMACNIFKHSIHAAGGIQNYDNMNKATWVLGWHSGTTCWVLSLGSIVCNSTPGWNVAVWWLGSLFIPFAPVTNQYQSMAATLCGWEGNQWCWDIFRVRSRIWGRTVEIEARARKWKRWTRHDWGSHPEVKARQMETEA